MSEINVSIVMATYNGDTYIFEQMQSILKQLGDEDEVIVSDDHSSDATASLIQGLADRRIRVVKPPMPQGPIFNFDHGLAHARGSIVVLSDQDDVWLPGRLAVIRDYFSKSPHTYDLLVLDSEVVDESLQTIEPSVFNLLNAGVGLLKNIYRNTYIGCHMAFKRALLDVATPFPRRIPMHDVWLGLASELVGQVTFRPGRSMLFRRTGKNYTKSKYPWHTRITWRLNLVAALLRFALSKQAGQGQARFPGGYGA